jgi:hypothetical protein
MSSTDDTDFDWDAYKRAVLQIDNNGGRVEPGHVTDAKPESGEHRTVGGES